MPSFFKRPTPAPSWRRLLLGAAAVVLVLVVGMVLARAALTRLAINRLLRMAGASEITFQVTAATPWNIAVENLSFRVRTQSVAAQRVSLHRAHWWTPSLGAVKVEQARVPLTIDGSDVNPWAWSHYQNGTAQVAPWKIPAEDISLDGEMIFKAAVLPDQVVKLQLAARPGEGKIWHGQASAEGTGLGVKAEGTLNPATNELTFRVTEAALDLQRWQAFAQRVILLPGGAWELAGKFQGSAEGRWAGKVFAATAHVQLREGRAANAERGVAVEGVEADLEFTDLDQVVTKPGALRVRSLQVGQVALRAIDAEIALESASRLSVTRAKLQTLGGSVTAEPFKYYFNQRQLDVVLRAENISVEEVMALTKDLPAKASGRVDGRLPIHIDEGGFRLGTGWLALTPGVAAQIQFNAAGLLTNGVAANSPSYSVLKKLESGLLQLKVGEMRLVIRPPDSPAGRSAQLHVSGEPVDPTVKAPVTLDLNVNGPLEKLLNLGLDSRVSFK